MDGWKSFRRARLYKLTVRVQGADTDALSQSVYPRTLARITPRSPPQLLLAIIPPLPGRGPAAGAARSHARTRPRLILLRFHGTRRRVAMLMRTWA